MQENFEKFRKFQKNHMKDMIITGEWH